MPCTAEGHIASCKHHLVHCASEVLAALWLILGQYWDDGKESGNCYKIRVCVYIYIYIEGDNGKENGTYYNGVMEGLGSLVSIV